MLNASIAEIFSSVQGEGPWVGQRQIFVRFIGCDIACKYCDTRQGAGASQCRVQTAPLSFYAEEMPSLVSSDRLTALCSRLIIPGPYKPVISLTGGEPLLHAAFLAEWLPGLKEAFRVYLETSGIHYKPMQELGRFIDLVSMDLKLPSAAGLKPLWDLHERFLSALQGRSCYAKSVVTGDTCLDDVLRAVRLLAGFDPAMTFVIQPATGAYAPDADLLIRFQNAALGVLGDVRVIPQIHPMLKLP
jgi:organic radical activating enzyme